MLEEGRAVGREQLLQGQGLRAGQIGLQSLQGGGVRGVHPQRVALQNAAFEGDGQALVEPAGHVVLPVRINAILQVGVEGLVIDAGRTPAGCRLESPGRPGARSGPIPSSCPSRCSSKLAFDRGLGAGRSRRRAVLPCACRRRCSASRPATAFFKSLQFAADVVGLAVDLCHPCRALGQVAAHGHDVLAFEEAGGILDLHAPRGEKRPILLHRVEDDQPRRPGGGECPRRRASADRRRRSARRGRSPAAWSARRRCCPG